MKGDLIDCLRWTLLFGKYTGFVPLVGLSRVGENPRFRWKSIYMFVYIPSLISITVSVFIQMYACVCSGFEMMILSTVIFYGIYFVLFLLFLRFCLRCKGFLTKIKALEKLLPPTKKPRSIVKSINLLIGINVLLGFVEHMAHVIYSIFITFECYKLPKDAKSYFTLTFGWYFKFFPFSYILGIILQIFKLQVGVMWFYSDMFIMGVCVYLKNRFKDFNRLILNKNNMFTKTFKPTWSELQVHYNRISQLVIVVDNHINSIVFFSCAYKMYHISQELYFILNKLADGNTTQGADCAEQERTDLATIVLKLFYVMPVIIRITVTFYLASEVNVASRMPLMALHTIPSSAFDTNLQRFMTQVYYSKLGLTGFNFFLLTREVILSMIAKLLTYEMVVVQF